MPRTSPFTVVLTAGERRELEARARRYTSPYRDVIRAKIVLLAASGLRNDEIAAVVWAAADAVGGVCPETSQVSILEIPLLL